MEIALLVMVTIGLSMEFYAVVVCKSALLAKIDTTKLIISCLLIGGWQLVSLAVGNFIGRLLNMYQFTTEHHAMNGLLSMIIFAFIGFHMAKNAWKNESILEKRVNDLKLAQITAISFHFGFYSLITGLALSLMSIPFAQQAVVFTAIILCAVLLGFFVGYRFGYQSKTRAYIIGCVLLFDSAFVIGLSWLR